ncbi:MAG TPA: polyprenol monophosphomannose synthase [Planctomycetota bacterium]|nr:polyprenol monophosphomannose synthase [Planctomycetota bacterium]
MRTLVVVPTYNERENILPLARGILAALPEASVLVVDDASPDGTGEAVRDLSRTEPRARLLARTGKLGLGTAYLAGFEHGLRDGFEAVVTMDADFSHDPTHLPALVRGLRDRDVMIGSRYVPGGGIRNWGLHRRLLSSGANLVSRLLLRIPARDVTSGYRAYRCAAIRRLELASIRSSGYAFLEEVLLACHRAGLRIGETPIVFVDRRAGRSKISRSEIFAAAKNLFRLARRR